MTKLDVWIPRLLIATLAVKAILYGGSKPPATPNIIEKDPLLVIDNKWFGYTTNIVESVTNYVYDGSVHIEYHIIPEWELIIPSHTPVFLDYTEKGVTNWNYLAYSNAGAGYVFGMVEDPTNKNYSVYLYYQPTPTNGVFHIDTLNPKDGVFVPLKVGIEVDGEKITPTDDDAKTNERISFDE